MSEREDLMERLEESYFIFSQTGDTEDYSFMAEDLEALEKYDELEDEDGMEM